MQTCVSSCLTRRLERRRRTLNVTKELFRRGYTEEEIEKIWGDMLLRVWREVERVRPKLQKKENPLPLIHHHDHFLLSD